MGLDIDCLSAFRFLLMAFMFVVFCARAAFAGLGELRSGCTESGGDDCGGLLRNLDRMVLEELGDLVAGDA